MEQETPLLPPRYRPETFLGEGATGAVWRTADSVLKLPVAIKVVRKNLAVHARFRTRFAREVSISAQEIHPRLVPIHDYGKTTDDRPFVAMAYAPSGNLGDLLATDPPLEDVVWLLDEVLEALGHLHARGLIHQDLKPQNILLRPGDGTPTDQRYHAWVCDFGETHAFSWLVHDPRNVGGTPIYMAPEQLSQEPDEMGPWTDLYAVGLLLWETLCGTRPHRGESRKDLLAERLSPLPVPTLPNGKPLPACFEEILENLLDPDPRQRYDRAADLRHALRNALREIETGVRVRPVGFRDRVRRSTGPVLPTGEAPLNIPPPPRSLHPGVMRWNQVLTDPLPPQPPPAYGKGASARTSLSLLALRDLPLIGRDELRQAIWDVARRVVDHQEPGVVVLVGDSGTGKTRLVDSVARPLEEAGVMEVVRLRFHRPPGLDDGYRGAVLDLLSPWQESRSALEERLARWISRDRRTSPEEARAEAAVLARWCGYRRPGENEVNAAVGLAFLYRHLDARAWRGGACLVLDDVHRSVVEGDGLSIAQALMDRTVGERPVLVLATVAAESLHADAGLRDRLRHLEQSGAVVLQVPPLTLEETRLVLDEALVLDPELVLEISRVCSGNPLAVTVLLRSWAARDLLVLASDGAYHLREGVPLDQTVPGSIEQLHLDRLHAAVEASEDPVATAEALAVASIAGQEPPTWLVREVSETGLDSLLAAGVLREVGDSLSFEHGSVQTTALHLASRLPEMAELHLRLAALWRQRGERMGIAVDFPVAYHLLNGQDPTEATAWFCRAMRTLVEEGRCSLAAWVATRGLEAAERSGQAGGRQEIRRLHAEALIELRSFTAAERVLLEALAIEPCDRLTRARIGLALSRATMGRGDLEACRRYLEQAASAFEAIRDRDGLRDVAHGRATLERLEGRPGLAVQNFHEALRLLRRDPRREVLLLAGLVEALLTMNDLSTVDAHRDRMMALARESGDTRSIAQAAYTAAMVHLFRRQLGRAERYLQTASALAATLGADWLHLNCQNYLGEVARFRGDMVRAREHYERYCTFAEEQGLSSATAVGRVNLALLALQVGDDDAMRDQIALAESALANQPRHWSWVFVGLLHAWMSAMESNEARTRAWWSVAQDHGLSTLHTPDLLVPLQRLADACSSAGWRDLAKAAVMAIQDLGGSGPVQEVVIDDSDAEPVDSALEDGNPRSIP
ncbi:MAG: protein kinase [Deltaproteobacteria bacterium]|nr:protein kinase [Deltaproteobacteria bacterium]